MTIDDLTVHQFINFVRHGLGLDPLPRTVAVHRAAGSKSYTYHERICRLADAACKTCEGSGYTMGCAHDPVLVCRCVKERAAAERRP